MHLSVTRTASVCLATLVLAGCGGPDATAPGADGGTTGAAAVEEAPDIDVLLANADVDRGETLYFQCRACHTLEEGGQNKVGPNLWGMFGREAGSVPGFAYSDALANSGVVWSVETVNQWLEQPANYLPGNIMVFIGVKDPQDRANLIAFLQETAGATP